MNSGDSDNWEKYRYQLYFGHHKSQVEGPRIEPVPPGVKGRRLNA
jgi:hypothetical protein